MRNVTKSQAVQTVSQSLTVGTVNGPYGLVGPGSGPNWNTNSGRSRRTSECLPVLSTQRRMGRSCACMKSVNMSLSEY